MRVTIDLPNSLHQKLKESATASSRTMREVVIAALEDETSDLSEQELSQTFRDSRK